MLRGGAFALFAFALACGARTDLGGPRDERDASLADATADHAAPDVAPDAVGDDAGCPDLTGDPTPPATSDLGTACDEGENTTTSPGTGCWTSGPAWEWVPDHDMSISRIELWTEGGNQVAFYADDAGKPGTRLFLGSTGGASGDAAEWRGADVSPTIGVLACHRYYVHQVLAQAGTCSWTYGGVWVNEFTPNPNGGWDGPFPGQWTARFRGACQ